MLEAHNLAFRYQGRMEPVIFGCNLQIWAGDQLLLRRPIRRGQVYSGLSAHRPALPRSPVFSLCGASTCQP